MKGNKELAVKKFKQGYNCCQAVACAYCEELGIKEEDVFRLTEGFGLAWAASGYLRGRNGECSW